jgi:hypothetical protein
MTTKLVLRTSDRCKFVREDVTWFTVEYQTGEDWDDITPFYGKADPCYPHELPRWFKKMTFKTERHVRDGVAAIEWEADVKGEYRTGTYRRESLADLIEWAEKNFDVEVVVNDDGDKKEYKPVVPFWTPTIPSPRLCM